MTSDNSHVPRRCVLQMGAAGLATSLAGCSSLGGSDGSDEPEDDDDTAVSSTPEDTSTPEPDYSLPESERADPVDLATKWMLTPAEDGEDLDAVAFSPQALAENYDVSFIDGTGVGGSYEVFEFSHADIPMTYMQEVLHQWESFFAIDQLPNNVSIDDLAVQLQDAGYSKQDERGGFEIFDDGREPHAIGEDQDGNERHIGVMTGRASESQRSDLMERLLREDEHDLYNVRENMRDTFDAIDVRDGFSIQKHPGLVYMPSIPNYNEPQLAVSSVDFEEGKKYGAWPFPNERDAQAAVNNLKEVEVMFGYGDNIETDGRVAVASDGDYSINELDSGPDSFKICDPTI